MPKTVTFIAKDYAGVPHEYETMLFDPSEGVELYQQVTAAVGEPIAVLVYEYTRTGNADLAAEAAKATGTRGIADMIEYAGDVDAGRIGRAASNAIRGLNPNIARRLLSKTYRDKAPLANPPCFDDAYCANYTEMSMALWEVVKANRFLPSVDTLFAGGAQE